MSEETRREPPEPSGLDADPLARIRGAEPGTTGIEEQQALGRVCARMFAAEADEVRVGRYLLREQIGRGAMGTVYRARDPDLDRDVAIKVMPSADGDTRQRMLREAEALARLSDPNVVQVFDVGTYDLAGPVDARGRGGVFIVMELVPDGTLAEWLEVPRSRDDVLVRLIAAGRGLAAAHAAGLIHRDFKPTNVLIAGDRVLVSDFGLVRAASSGDTSSSRPDSGAGEPRVAASSGRLGQALTHAGTTMGTPAYMPPEQHRGDAVDERSDQYALCVSLWEALYGRRPFVGSTFEALARAKRDAAPSLPADAPVVPGSIRRALLRGLSPDPAMRWPSVTALLDELSRARSRDPTKHRSRWLATGVALAAGVSAWGLHRLHEQRVLLACASEGEQIAQTWSRARADEIAAAFESTGIAYATDTWTRSRERLDAYAQEWAATRVGVCQDAEVLHVLAPELAQASRTCMDEHRDDLDALVQQLARPDATVIQKAALESASLPLLTACTDETQLGSRAEPPSDPERLELSARLRKRLSEVDAASRLGRYDEALRGAEAVLEEATALQWAPLTAQAKLAVGDALESLGRHEEARDVLQEAYFEAVAAGRDELALRVGSALVFTCVSGLAQHEEGLHWGRTAQMLAARLEAPDSPAVAELLSSLGVAHSTRGENAEAIALYEQSLAIWESTLGPEHPKVAQALDNLGVVHGSMGDHELALELYERALAIWESTLGPEHPDIAPAIGNLGTVHYRRGDLDRALALYERAHAIFETTLGPEHPTVAYSFNNLGALHHQRGDYDKALALHERALVIKEKVLGADHPHIADSLHNVGAVHLVQGEHAEALAFFQRALVMREKALGPEHAQVADTLNNIGLVLVEQGAHAEAVDPFERALAIFEKTFGPEHANVALVLYNLGELQYARGEHVTAREALERALAIRERITATPSAIADTRLALARVLWDGAFDRTRAHRLAQQAAEVKRSLREPDEASLTDADDWLASHPAPSPGRVARER